MARDVGDLGDVIGLDHFGASAPGPVLMREYGFTVENVCKRALALLRRKVGLPSAEPKRVVSLPIMEDLVEGVPGRSIASGSL